MMTTMCSIGARGATRLVVGARLFEYRMKALRTKIENRLEAMTLQCVAKRPIPADPPQWLLDRVLESGGGVGPTNRRPPSFGLPAPPSPASLHSRERPPRGPRRSRDSSEGGGNPSFR